MNSGGGSRRNVERLNDEAPGYAPDSTRIGEDPELESVLRDFRSSIHAWSEAAYRRPRVMDEVVLRRAAWRRIAIWSLGSMLVIGVAGGGFLEHLHLKEMARIASAREAQYQRQAAEQRARKAEQDLAQVDIDVARQVPNALEPLAQLMAEDESR